MLPKQAVHKEMQRLQKQIQHLQCNSSCNNIHPSTINEATPTRIVNAMIMRFIGISRQMRLASLGTKILLLLLRCINLELNIESVKLRSQMMNFKLPHKVRIDQYLHANTLDILQTMIHLSIHQKMGRVETDHKQQINFRNEINNRCTNRTKKEEKTTKETRKIIINHHTHAVRALVTLV